MGAHTKHRGMEAAHCFKAGKAVKWGEPHILFPILLKDAKGPRLRIRQRRSLIIVFALLPSPPSRFSGGRASPKKREKMSTKGKNQYGNNRQAVPLKVVEQHRPQTTANSASVSLGFNHPYKPDIEAIRQTHTKRQKMQPLHSFYERGRFCVLFYSTLSQLMSATAPLRS